MRTYAFNASTASIAYLVTITRIDGEVFRITTWPQTIKIGAVSWTPGVGLTIYDIAERSNGDSASTQISFSTYPGGLIDPVDVAFDMFAEAEVLIELCDPFNPDTPDFHFYGKVGNKSKPIHGVVTFELINPHGSPNYQLVKQYTPMCRFAFGNVFSFCGMPIMQPHMQRSGQYAVGNNFRFLTGASPTGYGNVYFEVTSITTGFTAAVAPTFNYTVDATTVDGGVTWTARSAWERACEVATIADPHTFTLTALPDLRASADGWYGPGMFMPVTGRNANRAYQLGLWEGATLTATSYRPVCTGLVVGDLALIWPDCDKTLAMCDGKYANARRYGGYPYYAGAKAAGLVSG